MYMQDGHPLVFAGGSQRQGHDRRAPGFGDIDPIAMKDLR
jgi:hypothetical protein